MRFENKTVYDRKTLEKMNRAVDWVVGGRARAANRLLTMIAPLALFGSGFYIARTHGLIPVAVGEMAIGAFLAVWFPFIHRFRAWMASRLMLKNSPTYTIAFEDGGYVVSSTTTYGAPTECTPYDSIWRMCETGSHYVLLLNRRSAYMLDKNGFTVGTAMGFRDFIRGKTGEDFEQVPL